MTRLALTVFALLPLLLAAQASFPLGAPSWESRQSWQKTTNLDGRFAIEAPAPFRSATDTLQTALGTQIHHTFWCEAPDPATADNVIYALSYVDYPEGALPPDSTALIQELLTTTEAEAAAALKGTITYGTDETFLGHPARRWRIDYKDGEAYARTLALVANNRYYEVKTFSLSQQGLNKSSDRFFERFRIF